MGPLLAVVLLLAPACGGDGEPGADAGAGAAGSSTAVPGATASGTDGGSGTTAGPAPEDTLPPCAFAEGCAGAAGGTWTSLPGYTGPLDDAPLADRPVVDEATVRTSTEGPWTAEGLVATGPAPVSGPAVVEAVLLDAGGAELARVEGPVLIAPLRAGEAAPFRVAAEVPAEQVAEVGYAVRAEGVGEPNVPLADAVAARRGLRLAVFWTRPFGGDDPVAVPGYVEPPGLRPHLVYGEAVVDGATPVEAPRVVAAWLDDDGRVLAVAESALRPPGTDIAASRLEPGGTADLVLAVEDPAVGPRLEGRDPILWGVGS